MKWKEGFDIPKKDDVYLCRLKKTKRVSNIEYVKDAGGWDTSYPANEFQWLDESEAQPVEPVFTLDKIIDTYKAGMLLGRMGFSTQKENEKMITYFKDTYGIDIDNLK